MSPKKNISTKIIRQRRPSIFKYFKITYKLTTKTGRGDSIHSPAPTPSCLIARPEQCLFNATQHLLFLFIYELHHISAINSPHLRPLPHTQASSTLCRRLLRKGDKNAHQPRCWFINCESARVRGKLYRTVAHYV